MAGQTQSYLVFDTPNDGTDLSVTHMADGSVKLMYRVGYDIFVQNYLANGALDGAPVQLASGYGYYVGDLKLTELPDGQYLASWRNGHDVMGVLVDSADTPLTDVIVLSEGLSSSTGIGGYSVMLTVDGLVELDFWQTDIYGQDRLAMRIFDQTEGVLSAPNDYGLVSAVGIDTANGIGGEPLVVIMQGTTLSIKYKYPNGSLQTGPVFTGSSTISNPDICGLADGNVVISAYDYGVNSVVFQIFDNDGDAVSIQIAANVHHETSSTYELTALSNGDFAVTWYKDGYVYTQRFDAHGAAIGSYDWMYCNTPGTFSVSADTQGGYTIMASSPNGQASSHMAVDIRGSALADTITGTVWGEAIFGLDGADTIDGNGGGDVMAGGNGDDTYVIRSWGDEVHEALLGGYDKALVWSGSYEMDGNLEEARAQGTGNIEIYGNGNANLIVGNAGSNWLAGRGGKDTLRGGANADSLSGGTGDDVLDGGTGDDQLDGEEGIDTATYASASAGVTVSLAVTGAQATGGAGNDSLTAIENLTGSKFADTLTGNSGNNTIEGGAGNDTLNGGGSYDWVSYASAGAGVTVSLAIAGAQATGGAGTDTIAGFEAILGSAYNDRLTGNAANNIIIGGAGDDVMDGGGGIDTANYSTATAAVTVFLSATYAQNTGGAGTDTLAGFENLRGSDYDDALYGTAGANRIVGGVGADRLYGQDGADILEGGRGRDVMYGGLGADTFVFDDLDTLSIIADVIPDWNRLQGDKVDLSAIDADTTTVGDQAFVFNAGSSFSGIGSEIYIGTSADGYTTIYGDTDGDKHADFAIKLGYGGVVDIQQSDLVL